MADKFNENKAEESEKLDNERSTADAEAAKRKKKLSYVFAINDADESLDRLKQLKSGRF